MRLSVLVASIPSRWDMTKSLVEKIESMIGDKEIEVLVYFDNKKRSIGQKREDLKNMSNGKFFLMIDSDDDIVSLDEIYEATLRDVDVITFDVECSNNDGSTYIVSQGLGNEIEHNTKDGRYLDCKRPPWWMCAWHNKFKQFHFPPINYSEDYEFLKHCWLDAKTEYHIDKVLYKYDFNPLVSEASTESNSHWQNPNT